MEFPPYPSPSTNLSLATIFQGRLALRLFSLQDAKPGKTRMSSSDKSSQKPLSGAPANKNVRQNNAFGSSYERGDRTELYQFERYNSRQLAQEVSMVWVVLNPIEPDGIQTGLQPLPRDKFQEVLGICDRAVTRSCGVTKDATPGSGGCDGQTFVCQVVQRAGNH
jgi:hypothetical protein